MHASPTGGDSVVDQKSLGLQLPRFGGRSLPVRMVNAVRRRAPRLSHAIEAFARVSIPDDGPSLTWRAVSRIPASPDRPVIEADSYKSAVLQLVETDDAYVRLLGLAYRVTSGSGAVRAPGKRLSQRRYATYDDYLRHQKSKLDREAAFIRETSEKRYASMQKQFAAVAIFLPASGAALCLGARLGEEVRVLREMGLLAIGVDLNPGPENPYCMYGDFHNLAFRENSFDLVFSNVLDHVHDMDRFMAEVVRIARPDAHVYFYITGGYAESGALDPYGATFWPDNESLVQALRPYVGTVIHDDENAGRHIRQLIFTPRKDAVVPVAAS